MPDKPLVEQTLPPLDLAAPEPAGPVLTTAPLSKLAKVDLLLTEHIFGWRWYRLAPAGIDKAIQQDVSDGQPNREHLLTGDRFLADPVYGGGQVIAGTFQLLEGVELTEIPIVIGMEKRVLPVTKNIGMAALALDRCEYVTYRKSWWPVNKKDGFLYTVRCSVDHSPMSPIGAAEAHEFAEAAAVAVARAFGLI